MSNTQTKKEKEKIKSFSFIIDYNKNKEIVKIYISDKWGNEFTVSKKELTDLSMMIHGLNLKIYRDELKWEKKKKKNKK
jgi:hypothetical protein